MIWFEVCRGLTGSYEHYRRPYDRLNKALDHAATMNRIHAEQVAADGKPTRIIYTVEDENGIRHTEADRVPSRWTRASKAYAAMTGGAFWRAILFPAAAGSAITAVMDVMFGWWPQAFAMAKPAFVGAAYAAFRYRKEVRHGSRRTAGDCDDPGTGESSDAQPDCSGTSTAGSVTVGSLAASYQRSAIVMGNSIAAGYLTVIGHTGPGPGLMSATGATGPTGPAVGYQIHEGALVLPEREDDTPILAHKTAGLVWDDQYRPALQSTFTSVGYDQADTASCQIGGQHQAPDMHCTCGFYAVRNPDALGMNSRPANAVLITVELFGRVIVFEKGYRAERQRMLRIGVSGCWYCAGPSTRLVGKVSSPWEIHMEPTPVPVCDQHARFAKADLDVTFAEVAEVLGVPVEHEPSIVVHTRQQWRNVGS